nr:serine hydrolase domain-containing protein [Actinoplanes lichenis]
MLGGAPTAASAGPPDPVRQELHQLVTADGFPAALAAVESRSGRTRNLAAGVADTATGRPAPVDGQVRIGSNTKPFVAVVVLQLVAEGKVALDEPVETYLPGLVRGDGIDGRRITVRQLLQHQSGLPNYTEFLPLDDPALLHTYFEPRELLDLALAHPADFAPGTQWAYSNTNYVVAGLLVQKVTGRPLAEQITTRIVGKLGLRHTYFPPVGEQRIRERHPHGYQGTADVSDLDPSWGWAAGQMVATPSDLNAFFGALLDGKLLPPAQLAEMKRTVPAAMWPGARYGLGLVSTPLSCGGLAWGHGGDIPGYETRNAATEDGRAATVAVTMVPESEEAEAHVRRAVDTALCG